MEYEKEVAITGCALRKTHLKRKTGPMVLNKNPLLSLEAFGQSVWLDYLSRASLKNGESMSCSTHRGDAELERLQRDSFNYFLSETNPANGLVIDKTEAGWPASIAATGLGLASYPVAVERGFMPRAAAVIHPPTFTHLD